MYLAPHFKSENLEETFNILQNYSFATLVSKDLDDEVFASHIPIISEMKDGKIHSLEGHFARLNPHVDYLRVKPRATLIFNGPHTYITPTWYKSGRDVPTWNYVVVHVVGEIEFLTDYRELLSLLARTTSAFESKSTQPWKFELPADLKDEASLMKAIIGFRMKPTNIEAKFKLSQNRSLADRNGISTGLATRKDEMSLAIKSLIDRSLA